MLIVVSVKGSLGQDMTTKQQEWVAPVTAILNAQVRMIGWLGLRSAMGLAAPIDVQDAVLVRSR